jgi:hypothetical protein
VALNGSGALAVVEGESGGNQNSRVSVFDAGGSTAQFGSAFGWGVDSGAPAFETCTFASTCQVGLSGSGPGQLALPQVDAYDCRGALWVLDSGIHRYGEPGTGSADCSGTGGGGGSGDTTPPNGKIGKHPRKRTHRRKATFTFSSSEAGSTFTCKLDKKPAKPCSSPFVKRVKPGKHAFSVDAVDPAGNADPTPAAFRWKVLAP